MTLLLNIKIQNRDGVKTLKPKYNIYLNVTLEWSAVKESDFFHGFYVHWREGHKE